MAVRLTNSALPRLPHGVAGPAYDRSALRPGILHVGLGNFHRAHQAVYYDDLLNAGGDPAWGVQGAGVIAADRAMRAALADQDYLYTVTEMSAVGESTRVVGAIMGFADVEAGHRPILQAMDDPATRIFSLTVTEGGYFASADTGGFNSDDPAIRADIAHSATPTTIFGAIVAGLRRRRDANARAFSIMSCDNLPHNGEVTRSAVLAVAQGQDPELAAWIADNVGFPNSMVDRTTPGTTDDRRIHLHDRFGLDDSRPVFCGPFRQWVLEDSFSDGRPALEEAGVQFVSDVTPFEHMKIRMLNGGHALIAYPSSLIGLIHAHEAIEHPLISAFFDKVQRDEIYPVVPDVPGMSQSAYHAGLRDRLANPRVEDPVRRLCLDGSNRQPKFIVPSIMDNLAAGRPVPGLTLASALWCRYCHGDDEAGRAIEPNDPDWDRLTEQARAARHNPTRWIEMGDVYGDLRSNHTFDEAFARALNDLYDKGTESVLNDYLRSHP